MAFEISCSVDPPTPKAVFWVGENGGSGSLRLLEVLVDIIDVYLESHADAANTLRTPESVLPQFPGGGAGCTAAQAVSRGSVPATKASMRTPGVPGVATRPSSSTGTKTMLPGMG
jgi:hypothetical protein